MTTDNTTGGWYCKECAMFVPGGQYHVCSPYIGMPVTTPVVEQRIVIIACPHCGEEIQMELSRYSDSHT